MAGELASSGVTVRAIAADLADTGAVARLAERIRAVAGHPDVLYYGPSSGGSRPMAELAPCSRARSSSMW